MDIQWIKEQVEEGNYQLKLHALERASVRGIDPLEAKEALLSSEIILKIRGAIVVLFMEKVRAERISIWCAEGLVIYYG